jgi:hypothetical protein
MENEKHETAAASSRKEGDNPIRTPKLPVKVWTNATAGVYVAKFKDGVVVRAHIGKGKEFSEKEGFACVLADYVLGDGGEGHRHFNEAFEKVHSKRTINTDVSEAKAKAEPKSHSGK